MAGAMVNDSVADLDAFGEALSVTVTTTEDVPGWRGVPVMVFPLRVSPVGRGAAVHV